MAASPAFASIPKVGIGEVAAANTNRDGTGDVVDVLSAGTNGTKVNEIVVKATGDPADSIVTLFLNNGAKTYIFDEIDLDNPAAGSATLASYRSTVRYDNLILPSGWKLQAAITASPTAGVVNVIALAGDL